MGAYTSNFHSDSSKLVAGFTNPSEPDWITAHASVAGLAVVEVERLWERFLTMGANENGELTAETLKQPHLTEDVFMKNILMTFLSQNGNITFQSFINAMNWAEAADTEKKSRAIFHLMNRGNPINRDILERIIKRTYPSDSPASIEKIVNVFMAQMDIKRQGYIEEEQFIQWVQAVPKETIDAILKFAIIPPDINEAAHRAFTTDTLISQNRSNADSVSQQIPTDSMLLNIAEKAHTRDWQMLANRLGFITEDIVEFEDRNLRSTQDQVFDMLRTWRDKEGQRATGLVLENALRECNMNDLAMLLHP